MTITAEYQEVLLRMRKTYIWGTTGGKYAGDSIVKLLQEHPEIETILDYGCGEGSLKKWVEDSDIKDKKWTLYDPGFEEFKSPPKGKFDLVITTDVLEHVEEIMLNKVLDNLRELTGRFLYNEIACYYTGNNFTDGPFIGQDLHINMKAPDVWARRLQHREFTNIQYSPSILEGWKVRALIIQERNNNE